MGSALRMGSEGDPNAQSVSEIGASQFTDYLGQYDWTDRYTSLPPAMRGDFTSQYNPRTRQIYF